MSNDGVRDVALSPSIRAEAAVWVARLHGSSRSQEVEAGFRQWLAANPEHARAFELATDAWELGGSVAHLGLPRVTRVPRRNVRATLVRLVATSAVALAALTVAVVVYLRDRSLSTEVGEQRTLALEDGSRVYLNTDTRIRVDYDHAFRRVEISKGEARFDVTKSATRPFTVNAGGHTVTALGTSFLVRRDERRIAVTLLEGKVSVAPFPAVDELPKGLTAQVRTLTPGERLTFADQAAPALDRPAIEELTAWQRGEVVLDRTTLADAVEEMNRYSTVKLSIQDLSAAEIRVSGIFRAGDSERFALAVAETYQLEVGHAPGLIVLRGAPVSPSL